MGTAVCITFTTTIIGYLFAKYGVFDISELLGSIIGFIIGIILSFGAKNLDDLDDFIDTDSFFDTNSSDSGAD